MSRKDVAVGTVSDSVMLATNRAAGPVMGLAPGGSGEWGVGLCGGGGPCGVAGVACGATVRTTPHSPLPLGMIGSSAIFPFSNSSRHSWPTEAGSGRHLSPLPVLEPLAPLLGDGGGSTQPLLVHDLDEGGVMGTEDEFAHGLEIYRVSYPAEWDRSPSRSSCCKLKLPNRFRPQIGRASCRERV